MTKKIVILCIVALVALILGFVLTYTMSRGV